MLKLDVDRARPADRVRMWEQLLCENLIGHKCQSNAAELRGQIDGRVVDRGSVARALTSRQTLSRTQDLIQRSERELAIVALVTDGTIVLSQSGRSRVLQRGDLCVVDGARPYEASMVSDVVEHSFFLLPKETITRRVGNLAFGAYGPGTPLQKLVAAFLRGIVGSLEELDTRTLNTLLDQLLDLLALMVTQARRGAVEPSTHRSGMLSRVKAFIDSHLRDDDLQIDRAASALGISSRYINTLMASEGTSFGRYVLAQRLEGARREIMDPRRVHRRITEVAFGWGFGSASHFGRVYRDRFGMTPRETKTTGVRQ